MAKETINFDELNPYETLIYAIMLQHKKDNIKSTLNNVHCDAVEYILKYPLKIEEGATTIKALKKIAIDDKTTGEWKLKPVEFNLPN